MFGAEKRLSNSRQYLDELRNFIRNSEIKNFFMKRALLFLYECGKIAEVHTVSIVGNPDFSCACTLIIETP
mgnify:CR=1 FL=1